MIEEYDKLYLQKKLSFDKTQTINEIIKETDRINVWIKITTFFKRRVSIIL